MRNQFLSNLRQKEGAKSPIVFTDNFINPIIFTDDLPIFYDYGELFVRISNYIPMVQDYYYIGNKGTIFSKFRECTRVTISDERDGSGNYYQRVTLMLKDGTKKYYSIHRLVMLCFYPRSDAEELEVNHINGVKTDNYVNIIDPSKSNLEWVTPSENIKHAFANNLNSQVGENNSCYKITEKDVIKIADLIMQNNHSDKEIANIVGNNVTEFMVANIRNRNAWTYLTQNYDFPKRKVDKNFTSEDIHNFCKYLEKHKRSKKMKKELYADALREYGFEVNASNVTAVKVMAEGITYKKIRCLYNF